MIELIYSANTETYDFYENGELTSKGIQVTLITPEKTGVTVPGIIVSAGGKNVFEFPCYFNIVEKEPIVKTLNFIVNHFKISITEDRLYEIADNLYNHLLRLRNILPDATEIKMSNLLLKELIREKKERENNIFKKLFNKIKDFF